MSIDYKTVITKLDVVQDNAEVVAEVVGYLHGRDSVTDNSYTCPFIVPLETEGEIPGFIPYETLTSEVVNEWVTNALSQEQVNKMKKTISNKLGEMGGKPKIGSPTNRPLPW